MYSKSYITFIESIVSIVVTDKIMRIFLKSDGTPRNNCIKGHTEMVQEVALFSITTYKKVVTKCLFAFV